MRSWQALVDVGRYWPLLEKNEAGGGRMQMSVCSVITGCLPRAPRSLQTAVPRESLSGFSVEQFIFTYSHKVRIRIRLDVYRFFFMI